MKTLTKTQRETALRNRKTYTNPYLFDVRQDKDIRDLLREAAEMDFTVDLPAGAYFCAYYAGVDRMYQSHAEYALVSPKGKVKMRSSGMPENHNNWLKTVKNWVGIKG